LSETLQMIFANEEERNVTISVADPQPELGIEEVEPVMDSIIARNVFKSSGGELTAKVRAQVVTRTVDTVAEF